MALIKLEFEQLNDNGDKNHKAEQLKERLQQLDTVTAAQIEDDEDRMMSGLEIAGMISMGITVVDHSKDFVAALRRLVPEIKKLAQELGLGNVTVDLSGKAIPVSQLEGMSDEQVARANLEQHHG